MPYLFAIGIAFVALYITSLATTIYLHRGLAHRGIRFGKGADLLFRVWLWLSIGISRRQWVAVHRKHHRYTDVEGDPHSPYVHGSVWRVLAINYFLYRREGKNPETLRRYLNDLPADRWDRFVFDGLWFLGPVASMTGLSLALGAGAGIFTFWLHALLYIGFSGAINSICHWFGYRNFNNTATNVSWIAWLTAGEGWHNNHHAYPAAPKLAMAKGEWDPAWWLIRLLVAIGQADVRGQVRTAHQRRAFQGAPTLVADASDAA